MKVYLFEHEIREDGSRRELFIPGFAIIWTEYGEVIRNAKEMEKMQRRVDMVYGEISAKDFLKNAKKVGDGYTLVKVRIIPDHLVEDFVGWVKMEELSRKGREKSAKKLENLFYSNRKS